MLLEFTVGNYLSFKDRVTLDLQAASIRDFPENKIQLERYELLKSLVIYGANSSGKSNLIYAMETMRGLIRRSAQLSSTDSLEITPFLLSTETENAPSFFEALFCIEGIRYRYGFEASSSRIHTEWLFAAEKEAEKMLFVRDGDAIELSKQFKEGKDLEAKTRSNGLFLSVVDQFNGPTAKTLMKWFTDFNIISGLQHESYRSVTYDLLSDEVTKNAILTFFESLDLGFENIIVEEEEFFISSFPDSMPKAIRARLASQLSRTEFTFLTEHTKFDASNNRVGTIQFNLDEQESSGTQKLFDLVGPIFATLSTGTVLVVDELNSKLHPLLTKAIVGLFNSKSFNPNNAQLIFATHDTNLLSYGNFRRDQIYFIEKDQFGSSDLYSLLEYKEDGQTIRKDRSFEKDYIQGKYGAIPFLGNLTELFEKWPEKNTGISH